MSLSFLIIMTQNDEKVLMVLMFYSMVNDIFYFEIHCKIINASLLFIYV
jgi:hypothetical protein